MKTILLRVIWAFSMLAPLFVATGVRAEEIIGLITENLLVRFDSATPGTIIPGSIVPITGLNGIDRFDTIVGIDIRPATGDLWGLGTGADVGDPGSYRLYRLNAATGVASLQSGITIAPSSSEVGIDFNPVVDRLRVVNIDDQNFRIEVVAGTVSADTALAYAALDVNSAANPNIVGSAYTNNFPGASATVLYGIDSNLDIVVTQAPPGAGTLNTSGSLGVNTDNRVGFDISGLTGTAYASLTDPQTGLSSLYTIPGIGSQQGLAVLVGLIGGDPPFTLRDIAAPVGVPEPVTASMFGLGAIGILSRLRRSRTQRNRNVLLSQALQAAEKC